MSNRSSHRRTWEHKRSKRRYILPLPAVMKHTEDLRGTLNIALTHANRAVELDTRALELNCANLDLVSDAISAYSKSIMLINGVINELKNDPKGKPNTEDEAGRLTAIKKSYKDRVLILSAVPGTVINIPKL